MKPGPEPVAASKLFQHLLHGKIKRTFYEFPTPSLYSLLSEAAAKEFMSTDVPADSRIAGVAILSPITRLESNNMDDPFMARAIQLSIENVHSGRGGPFGAVIVKDGNIIAEGANQVTSTKDPTAHAEILAIRTACGKLGVFELQGCEIYTSCEPCPMCLGAIYWARLSCIYFASVTADASRVGFDDSLIYREIAGPRTQRAIPMVQVMREEALAAFHAWEEKPNKMVY